MRRFSRLAVIAVVLCTWVAWGASAQELQPLDVDEQEEVEVNLVIVDALVMDKQGQTVPGLTRDVFLLSVQGQAREIDTFDVICPDGARPDPKDISLKEQRERVAAEPERRIVLAFDYYHLSRPNRTAALRWGQVIASRDMAPGDGIMIAALADGLRIEQRFSGSPKKAVHTLNRMEHDVTLYGRDFGIITPRSFLDNLSTLADVLAQYPGPKVILLFSEWVERSDDWDLFFLETAEHAAAARAAIYPVWAPGLQAGDPAGGSPSLARLATESGGRFTQRTNDLSLGYARAQRDLNCRYAIGYYADADAARKARTVSVRLKEGGHEIRSPERIRLWTDKERRASQLRAAFADPGPNEDPLVRAVAFPFRPMSNKSWEALLAVSFPLHIGEQGASRDIGASLDAAHLNIERKTGVVDFPAPKNGKPGLRPVTLYAMRKVKPGPHTLTIAINEPGTDKIQTTRVEFAIPEVPQGQLIVRGPFLARVDPDGIRMRVDDKEVQDSELDELIGDAGFVPLLVSQVKPDDTLIAAWAICAIGTSGPSDATVDRRILAEGEVVHRLEPIPLELQGKKKLLCQGHLDKLPGGMLGEGKYRFEVAVVKGTTEKARGLAPFALATPPPDEPTETAAAQER
jgi:VWFA-related protein